MTIEDAIKNKILILDGAMGTMIQRYSLTEEDYRGDVFAGCIITALTYGVTVIL